MVETGCVALKPRKGDDQPTPGLGLEEFQNISESLCAGLWVPCLICWGWFGLALGQSVSKSKIPGQILNLASLGRGLAAAPFDMFSAIRIPGGIRGSGSPPREKTGGVQGAGALPNNNQGEGSGGAAAPTGKHRGGPGGRKPREVKLTYPDL